MPGLDTSLMKIFARGADLSASMQSTALEQSRDEVDITTYPDPIRVMQATFPRVSLAHAGLYQDGPNTIGEIFRAANVTDEEPFTICPNGAVVGERAFIVVAHRASVTQPDGGTPGQVFKTSFRASARAMVPSNGVVAFNGTVNSDTATTPLQIGAPAAGQEILAHIHLYGIVSTPAAVFFLESDNLVGFGSPTVQATSASQTARGSVLLRKAGSVTTPVTDDWWRVRWDWTTPGSFTAVIALGLAGS